MTNEGMLCALENGNKVILITIDEWKVQFFRLYLLSVCFLTYNYFLQGMGDKLVNNASLQGESLQKKKKSQDNHFKKSYGSVALVAYRRQKNIREKLIRAKIPKPAVRPTRVVKSMKPCNRCVTCLFISKGSTVRSTANNFKVDLNTAATCQSNMIGCLKCVQQYISETNKTINQRFQQHKGYVNNKKLDKATRAHFNLPGHSVSDMRITMVEKIYNQDNFFRKEREKFYINKFHSKLKGLNRKT